MLEIKEIRKEYRTGELVQKALDGVSLVFRDSEFVSILGPSGSGKTTLLNIIGGLDRYDSGDLVINGISTKEYTDQDWDAYRNHSIGFVFQNYNLIPHQSILANVELALTISGESKSIRKQKAKKALEQVGLGDQLHKKPNQMSGGQMQRVAIARALVNDPDILLADEPTGALDSETSVQIMELLKEVARDRLVVMVTHNGELAEEYSTRIVRLKDGKIIGDSDPCTAEELAAELASGKEEKESSKARMSFGTALSLSFNNLKTKKSRTVLTSLAGSIGIIGIALILALSSGVNDYIATLQADTMTSYPITISATNVTKGNKMERIANGLTGKSGTAADSRDELIDNDLLYTDYSKVGEVDAGSASVTQNDLTSFKNYLENPDSEIQQYIGENGIIYSYDVNFDIYSYDADGIVVSSNADVSEIGTLAGNSSEGTINAFNSASASSGAKNFEELMPGTDTAVSGVVTENYDVLCGRWPESYNEVVIVLDEYNSLSAGTMYQLGLMTGDEYAAAEEAKENDEEPETLTLELSSIVGRSFYMLPACDHYTENADGSFTWHDVTAMDTSLLNNAVELKVIGVVRPAADAENASIGSAVGYTSLLTDYIVEHTEGSAVVTAQEATPDINVLNGMAFEVETDEEKVVDAITYLSSLGISEKANWWSMFSTYMETGDQSAAMAANENEEERSDDDEISMAASLDEWLAGEPEQELLLNIYKFYVAGSTYDDNMTAFGAVSFDTPASISIYVDSFEDKEAIAACIENYNASVDSDTRITYTDYVSTMTSSITSMVDMISLILICFVAVSLIVSCIMISIITNISVLERTKEIGVLRALGASKKNVSHVFNAETFIIGVCAGLMGVIFAALLTIPINAIVASALGVSLTASLPVPYAVLLVAISIVITMIGGLIPAKKAAKMDPVLALRSE